MNLFAKGFAVVLVFSVSSSLHAQSLLDQLERKVRAGLELEPPKADAKNSQPSSGQPSSGQPADSELPAPTKKTAPPPPSPSPSSILDAPQLKTAEPDMQAAEPGIYLGLEAESLTGGGIGARVVNVTDNSPAWRAGFKPGDVILAIDGFAITNLDTMVDRLSLRRPGRCHQGPVATRWQEHGTYCGAPKRSLSPTHSWRE